MTFKYTDYHVHSNWSGDVPRNGPGFEDYAVIAENKRINVCFLEHYEMLYIERYKTNRFYGDNINDYLEELDGLKETYDFILAGLEVEYYEERELELMEFMDDYGNELDFIAGTIHEWIFGYPITSRDKLIDLLSKIPMVQVIDDYFKISRKMITSGIFKNVCHIDTIFRYINENDIKPEPNCDISEERTLELGRLCIDNDIRIEYNLSGEKFPIKRPFPSKDVITTLKREGADVFIGSDSHKTEYFEEKIPSVKEAYEFIRNI